MVSTTRTPVVFLGHGTPSFFANAPPLHPIMMEFANGSENYLSLQRIPKQIKVDKPTAIVIISAHWEGHKVQISASEKSSLYYDYGGFSKETLSITYPAPTNPMLASQISSSLISHGVESELDTKRGWDHAIFLPLKLMFPEANIPVVAMSLHRNLDAKTHVTIGKALAPFRDQGVLIVGSGAVTHVIGDPEGNVRFTNAVDHAVTTLSSTEREVAFTHWRNFESQNQSDREGIAHFLPLLIAVGAAGEDKGHILYRRDGAGGRVVNCHYAFGL